MGIKVALVGNSGVGKTSLCDALDGCIFSDRYLATMGVDIHSIKTNYLKDNKPVMLQLWDSAGDTIYLGLEMVYHYGFKICVIMVDINSPTSDSEIIKWSSYFRRSNEAPIIVLYNKADDFKIEGKNCISVKNNDIDNVVPLICRTLGLRERGSLTKSANK